MSKASQCDSILHRLKQGPATTLQLGYGLNICCVTKRISELRRQGYEIKLTEQRHSGRRVCTYSLRPSNGNGAASVSEPWPVVSVLSCSECGIGFARKHKARPLRPGELPFCSDAHRARYHREHPRTDSHNVAQGNSQLLPMNGDRT